MKGGPILWNAIAICETSWQKGKRRAKDVWRTIQRPNNTFWSDGWISSVFTEGSIKDSSICRESITRNLSRIWADCGRRIWTGDILIADLEDLEKLDASNIYPRRIKASRQRKCLSARKVMNSFTQSQMEQQNCQEETTNSEHPLQGENNLEGVKIPVEKLKANRKSLNRQNKQMTLKPVDFFGSIQGDFIYRHHNEPQVQLHVPKEETFRIPLKYFVVLSQLILIWMYSKKRRLTITGMSIHASICLTLGEDSRNSFYWKRNLQKDVCGRGGDWQRFKRLPDQILCGQKFGRKWVEPLRIEKDKNGRKKSQSLTMLESWEEFTILIQTTENTQKFSSKNARGKLERPMAVSKDGQTASWHRENECTTQRKRVPFCVRPQSGISWIYETESRIFAV